MRYAEPEPGMSHLSRASRPWFIGLVLVGWGLSAVALPLHAQSGFLNPDGKGNVTFKPGLRLQPRYTYDNQDANNDFFIARTRIKANGEAFKLATYYAEIKLDNVGRFARVVNAEVENAWLDFPLHPGLSLRVGLYDAVFSRNALTSDSKLLLMDRSLIKDALTALGLADNTVGLLGHGRPLKGRFEYSVGMFDNLQFEQASSPTAKQADGTMQMARVGVHLLDPATPGGWADYRSSYVGQGRRLSFAVNAAYLSKAHEGADSFDITAWGGDLFFNAGPFTLESEFDDFNEDVDAIRVGGKPDANGTGWYVQGGYLLGHPTGTPIELAVRYQERDADAGAFSNGLQWTSLGLNYYLRDHSLKVQADYTFKREQAIEVDNDLFQVQLQLDY